MKLQSLLWSLSFLLYLSLSVQAQFSVPLPYKEVSVEVKDGKTVFSGSGVHGKPGNPLLPAYKVTFLLPEGTSPEDISVTIVDPVEKEVGGTYTIDPVVPSSLNETVFWPEGLDIKDGKNVSVYGRNAFFPEAYTGDVSFSKIRQFQLVSVIVYPYRYNPLSGKLKMITGGVLTLQLPHGTSFSVDARFKSTLPTLQRNAEKYILKNSVNPEVLQSYTDAVSSRAIAPPAGTAPLASGGYVIITTNEIVNGSSQLQNLIGQKTAAGYTVTVLTEDEWNGKTGDDRAEAMRQWLQDNYLSMDIEYVLLIGHPNSSTGDVPMKMILTRPDSSEWRGGPTDLYYAELTADWDSDMDGRLGEIEDFILSNGEMLSADVAVGRIPFYGNIDDLDKILKKSIDYVNQTSRGWRKKALLPMKPLKELKPAYPLGEAIHNEYLIPSGWETYRIYDKCNSYSNEYLDEVIALTPPIEHAGCSEAAVSNAWNYNSFGLVIWWTHGSSDGASGVFSSPAADQLDDRYPAMTFQASCENAAPEMMNNLAYSLLRNGAVSTIAATRLSFSKNEQTDFLNTSTNCGMGYTYGKHMVENLMSTSEALNTVKQDAIIEEDIHYNNMIEFNVYGCPDLKLDIDYTAPERLRVSGWGHNRITINWFDRSDNENGFYVERATADGEFTQIAVVDENVTSYQDVGLEMNTKYHYRVHMFTADGESDYSNIDSATTSMNIAPEGTITASSEMSGYEATGAIDGNDGSRWVASSGVMPQWVLVDLGAVRDLSGVELVFPFKGTSGDCYDFTIERSLDNVNWITQVNRNPNTETATVQTFDFMNPGRYIHITIHDAPGQRYASINEIRIFGSVHPTMPVWIGAQSVPEDQLELSWQPSAGAATYTVMQSKTLGAHRHVIAEGLTSPSFTTTGLIGGKTYIFSVIGVNDSGTSINVPLSNETAGTPQITAPFAPTDLTIAPDTISGYLLRWNDVAGNELWYDVERAPYNTSNWTSIALLGVNAREFVDAGASYQKNYNYRVSAVNSAGRASSTTANTLVPPLVPKPDVPYFSGGEIILSWNYTHNTEEGFHVQRSTDGSNYVTIANPDISARNYNDGDIAPNTSYYYQICAYNEYGESCSNAYYIGTIPAAPTNLSAEFIQDTDDYVQLSWTDNANTEMYFWVERAVETGAFEELNIVWADFTTFNDNSITLFTTYRYRVRAYNSQGYSDYSNIVVITPGAPPTPQAPSDLTAVAVAPNQINLTWVDNADDEDGFVIERAMNATGPWGQIATAGANTTAYYNNGLTGGITYWYRVNAFNGNGSSGWSNSASATTPSGGYGNLALSGTATASSAIPGDEYSVDKINDDNTGTRWVASSGAFPQWVTIDLGSERSVSEVEMVFAFAGTTGDCYDFTVETSSDNVNWTTRISQSPNWNPAQTQRYGLGATARYIRITVTGAPGYYRASLYEFRVFGQ